MSTAEAAVLPGTGASQNAPDHHHTPHKKFPEIRLTPGTGTSNSY
jgi:hypothetical protein